MSMLIGRKRINNSLQWYNDHSSYIVDARNDSLWWFSDLSFEDLADIYYGYRREHLSRERSRAFSINAVDLSKPCVRCCVYTSRSIVKATFHSAKKRSRKWPSAVLPPTVSIRLFAVTIRSSRLSFCRTYCSLHHMETISISIVLLLYYYYTVIRHDTTDCASSFLRGKSSSIRFTPEAYIREYCSTSNELRDGSSPVEQSSTILTL